MTDGKLITPSLLASTRAWGMYRRLRLAVGNWKSLGKPI